MVQRNSVDNLRLTRYTQRMPKQSPEETADSRMKLLGVKLPLDVLAEIEEIGVKEKRTKSQVGALLILRGLRLYREDGVLLEDEDSSRSRKRR